MFVGNQMGKIFAPAYRANLNVYLKHTADIFNEPRFYNDNKEALDGYLGELLIPFTAKKDVDLFAISSSLYLHTILFVIMGEEVVDH